MNIATMTLPTEQAPSASTSDGGGPAGPDVPAEKSQDGNNNADHNDKEQVDEGEGEGEGDTGTDASSYWTDDDDEDASYDARSETEMPLLKYGRVVGMLPRLPRAGPGADVKSGGDADGADEGAGPGRGARDENSAAAAASSSDGTTSRSVTPSIPSPLATPITCQCMGRIVLGPGARVYSSDAAPSASAAETHGAGFPDYSSAAAANGKLKSTSSSSKADEVTAKIRYVLALGLADGTVRVVDPITGMDIVPTGKLAVSGGNLMGDILHRDARSADAASAADQSHPKRIVAVSFDSSGTHLGAINVNGDAAVFELKYIAGDVQAVAERDRAQTGGTGSAGGDTREDHIANLLSAWTQQPPRVHHTSQEPEAAAAAATAESTDAYGSSEVLDKESDSLIQNLTVTLPVPTARFAYPPSTHSVPTCLVIDPTYRRRREKSVLVGFADGRLILTKRGMLFSRRSDSVIYQGVVGGGVSASKSGTRGGIEAVTWRGSLVAWADASGIKLFDIDEMIRIAHVDRPSGARTSLYPTISSLRPTLLFERPNSLLIAWGDCIMSMLIKERGTKVGAARSGVEGGSSGAAASPRVTKRRTVSCSVAWELDCVACGAVPLDAKYWAVLGLVPKPGDASSDQDNSGNDEGLPREDFLPVSSAGNIVELQVISRMAGTVVAADALPLVKLPVLNPDDGVDFSLISSYCTARMDEVLEIEEEELNGSVEDHAAQAAMFDALAGTSAGSTIDLISQGNFLDPHLKWSVDNVRFNDDTSNSVTGNSLEGGGSDIEDKGDDDDDDDDNSALSDDYTFLFRPGLLSSQSPAPKNAPLPVEPPTMIIASSRDLVLARPRDIDDGIAHSRSAGQPGKALHIALRDTRMVRRHNLNRLIDEYLSSLLRLEISSTDTASTTEATITERAGALTVSRLRLAAKTTPRLLGGHVEMWRKWITQFSLIPGGLFVLREYLPVRDPKLPSKVYEIVLDNMLSELAAMLLRANGPDNEASSSSPLHQDAANLFLKTLRAWGTTASISERVKVHRMFTTMQVWRERGVVATPEIQEAKEALYNRRHQTVVGYLQTSAASSAATGAARQALDKSLDGASSLVSSTDSLYSVEVARDRLVDNLNKSSFVPSGGEGSSSKQKIMMTTMLNALSELDVMNGNYSESLKLQLLVGANTSTKPLSDLENEAIRVVNYGDETSKNRALSYHRTLGHIEYHHLHWCLLDEHFLSSSSVLSDIHGHKESQSPILALIRLVGLDLSGCFLVDHCSLPQSTSSTTRRQTSSLRAQSLPIDLVCNQLKPTPKLLHWYLTQVFLHKPEVYVKFPNTAVPPRAITDLHRTHIDLHIKYAAKPSNKKRKLSDVPAYGDGMDSVTPLLSFLMAALPHGGYRPEDVRKMLEVCREGRPPSAQIGSPGRIGGVMHPHLFARELAYIIEAHCGKGSEEDAMTILRLHLEGVQSLPLAVEYVQRNKVHSKMLWDSLISYCLDPNSQPNRSRGKGKRKSSVDKNDGYLFGALLEVAARSGADIALLVSKIPKGMQIEGLRPRLVAAISDYRMKLQMHEAAAKIVEKDKVDLLRQVCHKSRRGVRIVPEGISTGGETEEKPFLATKATARTDIGRKRKSDASSLIEAKGERLFVRPERTGIIRANSLAFDNH